MNLPKKKVSLLVILFALAVFSVTGFLSGQTQKNVWAENSSIEGVLDRYLIGERLELPSVELEYNGNSYKANPYLILPNGLVKSVNTFTFERAGNYTLEYRARAGNALIKDRKSFVVADKLLEYNKASSSVSYGTKEGYKNAYGAVVSLATGDVLTVNKAIDLKDKTALNSLLKIVITPETIGVEDAKIFKIILTDAYDSENSVVLNIKKDPQADRPFRVYLSAAAGSQPQTGIAKNSVNFDLEYNGKLYRKHVNNDYGAMTEFSLTGLYNTPNISHGDEVLSISMDYAERALYYDSGKSEGREIVADFDDARIFTDLWGGFKTGEVFVTFGASNNVAASLNFIIKELDGNPITKEMLDFINSQKISFDVDYGGYGSVAPNAIVGKTYPVFEVDAYSPYGGMLECSASVYYAYNSSAPVSVNISNGKFNINYVGEYTIVYSATDSYGVTHIHTVSITAIKSDKNLTVDVSVPQGKSYVAGKTITVASANIDSYYSETDVKINAVYKADQSYVTEIDSTLCTFTPMRTGSYIISYTVSDVAENKDFSYEIEVVSEGAKFISKPELPKYLIRGASYNLPKLDAYNFSTTAPEAVASKITATEIKSENSADKTVSNGIYTVGDADKVVITYKIVSGEYEDRVVSEEIPVISVGYGAALDKKSYFYATSGEFNVESGSNYILFKTDENKAVNGKAKLDFINKQLSSDFSFAFKADSEHLEFSRINVYLTDSVNSNKTIKMSYEYLNATDTNFYVNDGVPLVIKEVFGGTNSFIPEYSNKKLAIIPSTGNSVKITKDLNGREFSGFTSEYINIAVELVGIKGASAIRIQAINGQQFDNNGIDFSEPLYKRNVITPSATIDSEITIMPVYFADVLDPNVTATVTVTKVNGDTLTSVDGVLLKDVLASKAYTFKLTEYGKYSISYVFRDTSGQASYDSSEIEVADDIPPVIKLKNIVETGKKNTKINLAQYELSDNLGGDIKIAVFLEYPNGLIVSFNQTYLASANEGVFKIHYVATDLFGNKAFSSYAITVN